MKKLFTLCCVTVLFFTGVLAQAKMLLKESNGPEVQSIDPQLTVGHADAHVVMALFEGLLGSEPKNLDIVPGVAETWETSPDGLTYTFHLRKNAKWSNGDPVTAQEFVYSWNRLLHPQLASEYAYMLYYLKNAQAYNQGKITDFSQVGVKATDDSTLVVTLERITPYFLQIMQFNSTFPVHKATVEKFGGMTARDSAWTRPENIVSNGPFKLTSWVPNEKMVVVKSETYWDKDNVKLDEAEIHSVDNILTEEKMFRSGMIDITFELPPEKIEAYKNEVPSTLFVNPQITTYFFWLNVKVKPLDIREVRQALYYAINRPQITEFVTKTHKPAKTLLPPGLGFTSKIEVQDFDVAKAQELLAKAGFPQGAGFPKLQLLYNTQENHRKIAEVIQQMWKKNLNIDVELINQDWKVYLDTLNTKNFQIARAGWGGDYADPNTFFEQVLTTSGTNRGNYSNPEYDQIIAESQNTLDVAKRTALFDKADQILFNDMPVIPIYYYEKVTAKSPKVQGWHPTPKDDHPLKYVFIE